MLRKGRGGGGEGGEREGGEERDKRGTSRL